MDEDLACVLLAVNHPRKYLVKSKHVIRCAKTRRWTWPFAGIVPPDPEPRFQRVQLGRYMVRSTPMIQYAIDHQLTVPLDLAKAIHDFQRNHLDVREFADLWCIVQSLERFPWDELKYEIDIQLAECVTKKTLGEKHAVYNDLKRLKQSYPILKTCLFMELHPVEGEARQDHRTFLEELRDAPSYVWS